LKLLACVLTLALAPQTPPQTPPPAGAKPPAAQPAPGQTPPGAPGGPGAPAATPAKPQGPYEFATDVGFFYVVVRNDKAAQFDAAMARLKQALASSTASPERKRQAQGWRVFKSSEAATPTPAAAVPPPPAGAAAPAATATPPAAPAPVPTIAYILVIDPVVKKASYDPVEILKELARDDVQATYDQLRESVVSITRISVTELLKMGGS
jgi:hypothetical protein